MKRYHYWQRIVVKIKINNLSEKIIIDDDNKYSCMNVDQIKEFIEKVETKQKLNEIITFMEEFNHNVNNIFADSKANKILIM